MTELIPIVSQLGISGAGGIMLLLIVLLFSCFFRFTIVLSVFRFGLGIRGAAFGIVTVGLALGLSYYVMLPQIERSLSAASTVIGKVANPPDDLRQRAFEAAADSWKEFLVKNTDRNLLQKFTPKTPPSAPGTPESPTLTVASWKSVAPAFLISELKHGTKAALMIILPFLVVDLLLALLLTGLGVENINVAVIAVPLKLLLLVAVDGWSLIAEGLIRVYG